FFERQSARNRLAEKLQIFFLSDRCELRQDGVDRLPLCKSFTPHQCCFRDLSVAEHSLNLTRRERSLLDLVLANEQVVDLRMHSFTRDSFFFQNRASAVRLQT